MKSKSSESLIEAEVVKDEDAIRKKYKKLKLDEAANTQNLEKSFKPITEPLTKIINTYAAAANEERVLNSLDEMEDESYTESDKTKYFDAEHDEDEEMKDPDEKQNDNQDQIDPVLETFFRMHYDPDRAKDLDKTYGIRNSGRHWMLGDSNIAVSGKLFHVKDKWFRGTPGLYELLFLKKPDDRTYDAHDLKTYREMILLTNAHRQRYERGKQVNSNKGIKYMNIIKGLLKAKTGTGVHLNSVRYEYWNDINEIVGRLRLVVASLRAGNTGAAKNEYLAIIEELKEEGIIQ